MIIVRQNPCLAEPMRELILKPCMGELDAKDRFVGAKMTPDTYDQVLEGPIKLLDPHGNIIAIIVDNEVRGAKAFYDAGNQYIYPSKARQVASVGETSWVKKLDGTTSKTTQLPPHLAPLTSIGGYLDRQSRVPYAHATMLCRDHPDKWRQMQPYINSVDEIFQKYAPEKYAIQKAVANEIPKDWVIGNTAFTTITMNKNFSLQGHVDANDLHEGLGIMSCLFLGEFKGGELVIPRFRVALRLKHKQCVLFDVHQVHGVTPISGSWGRFNRFTVVFYLRENLLRCGDAAYEIARGKRARHIGHLYDSAEIQLAKVRKERAMAASQPVTQVGA